MKAWPYLRDTYGAKAAFLGGKGGGKTLTCSAAIMDRVQKYPGCKGFAAAATYDQAIESCITEMLTVCDVLKIKVTYKKEMILDRKPHKHVYHFPEFESVVCVRSADNMDMIEGSKWDFAVLEEGSLWNEADMSTAFSRVRRGRADHMKLIAGLAEDEDFWLYDYIERGGFQYFQVSTKENMQNLPREYLDELRRMFPGELGKRYIDGDKVSLRKMPVHPVYKHEIHRNSYLSRRLTGYDPYRPLYITFDFNVAPVTVTLWQVKPVKFSVIRTEKATGLPFETTEIKNIICQVDEFEEWRFGTRGACKAIYEKYRDHSAGGVITGDASGNARDTRNVSMTDWSIIHEELAQKIPTLVLKKGLIINRNKSRKNRTDPNRSLAKYDNPPLKNSIENLNRVLLDGDGHPGMVFLPESRYESGGAAASVAATKYKADGSVDESPDKKDGTVGEKKKRKQTHYWATCRYTAWLLSPPSTHRVTDPAGRGRSDFEMDSDKKFNRRKPIM